MISMFMLLEFYSNLFTNIVCMRTLIWNIDGRIAYSWAMKIIGTLETVATGDTEQMESECPDYRHGFEAMRRMLPEGVRLISVRAER